ncbi:hypothetical protein GJW-30_1_02042 [Variibacter gotjawalensis]|uniref:Lysozyme inhibitor LprI-like N-terminal domain-containing protein n=1 Tax=Variibacter gotjawalensis TaxID=1333996 RepID=A0A0S3PU58_9BRAD|nr:lysozyme inhibitor LprI family protein [Variibacter gotjawalensis]NIK49833.1 hypothetical protein [Variibacter gotjawalensis]RZS45833.1 uncharacterized protein DUF1311 [Variibacter gotjawalensis]BAT59509.1 hypothetical protein GJW-30_1_02042 [Variibacter gotjawalensis]
MKMLKLAVAMLAANLFPLASMALAQAPTPADVAVIDKCLKGAEESGGFGGECVGLVAHPCLKEAAGKNDDVAQKKVCGERELAIWTVKMSEALKKVLPAASKDMSKAVADSQKTFAASRDRFCIIFDRIEPGIYPGSASYCRLRETANRTLSLIVLGVAVNEH